MAIVIRWYCISSALLFQNIFVYLHFHLRCDWLCFFRERIESTVKVKVFDAERILDSLIKSCRRVFLRLEKIKLFKRREIICWLGHTHRISIILVQVILITSTIDCFSMSDIVGIGLLTAYLLIVVVIINCITEKRLLHKRRQRIWISITVTFVLKVCLCRPQLLWPKDEKIEGIRKNTHPLWNDGSREIKECTMATMSQRKLSFLVLICRYYILQHL